METPFSAASHYQLKSFSAKDEVEGRKEDFIYADLHNKIYFGVGTEADLDGYTRTLEVWSYKDLEGKEFRPDEEHRDLGGFFDKHGFKERLARWCGWSKPRWDEEGNWNW